MWRIIDESRIETQRERKDGTLRFVHNLREMKRKIPPPNGKNLCVYLLFSTFFPHFIPFSFFLVFSSFNFHSFFSVPNIFPSV